jgi:transcriptional regulator with XRE-family HTH domain
MHRLHPLDSWRCRLACAMKTIYALRQDVVEIATNVAEPDGMTHVGDWQTIFGQTVRERRRELDLTLAEASAAIGISRSHLNLIELGKATGISRDCAMKVDAGLGFEGALLALLPASGANAHSTAHDVPGDREMRRADFNKAVLAIGASLLLDVDAERLFSTKSVDEGLLEDLESLTADFGERQHYARPQAILGPVRAHLRHLLALEGVSAAPDLRPRLARVTAETATLAGWVAFRGQGDLVEAHAQLALGRRHARESGDDRLMAQILGLSSSLYSSLDIPQIDKDQRPSLALSLLRAAQRKAGHGSPSLQGWLAARVAVERALLGEGSRARAALARAEAAVPSSQPDPSDLLVIWDETRIPGFAGKALLLLRDPAATGLLEQALAQTSAPHPRLGLLVDLAAARVHDGDADHAAALLIEATQLAVERGIDRFARWRLREGRAALPTAHQRMFDGRLHALA